MRSLPYLACFALAILAISGCSSSPTDTTAADAVVAKSEPTDPPTLGVVEAVDDVQAAYTEAGGDCAGALENRNNVKTALSSGVCTGSGTVLMAFFDHEDAKSGVEGLFGLSNQIGFEVIIGDNWVINPSGGDKELVEAIAESTGGQVVSKAASE